MRILDFTRLVISSIAINRTRSALTTMGIAIGIAAVVLLTSIGSGVSQFVIAEFSQFGTHIIQIQPGKVTTMGSALGALNTVRPLSIDDTLALGRMPGVRAAVGFVMGNAEIEGNQRQRRTTVYGTDPDFVEAFRYELSLGSFLPPDNPHAPRAVAVLGSTVRDELFAQANPVGSMIRIGGDRYRVVGVMTSKGQMMGIDLDDAVYVPTARAMAMFNQDTLVEIDLIYEEWIEADEMVERASRLLMARHGGDDVTIATQQQMMDVMGSILDVLSLAVAGLGGVSLLVGGIGVLTIMTITVRERTHEVGLLRAIGATRQQVLLIFLSEAAVLAALGGAIGLLIGIGGAYGLKAAVPALPVHVSVLYVVLAESIAIGIGILAGVMPAHYAARMLPVDALRSE